LKPIHPLIISFSYLYIYKELLIINKYIYLLINYFTDGGAKAAEITNALLFMVAKDNMPLNTVEKSGFQYFLKVTAPLYKIPARKQFTELMDNKYEMLSLLMMNKFFFFFSLAGRWKSFMETPGSAQGYCGTEQWESGGNNPHFPYVTR